MDPEQEAREEIDRQLRQAGWAVQDYREMDISAGPGVAVREFPLRGGSADYLLYTAARVIGVIEAKPAGHSLTGVETQTAGYVDALPDGVPCYHDGVIPYGYESTGFETRFSNNLDPRPRSRALFSFHRPEELKRQAGLDGQLRARLSNLPALNTEGLWPVQVEAIQNLERSLSENRPRALIQMATGSGKTYTACAFSYRLIKFAKAKRILFLVDRNTLGRQALTEFQQYTSPYNAYKFTEEFNVQRLTANTIDPAGRLCITTIQRLYSILKGEEEFREENEEHSMFESESGLSGEAMPVVYNPAVPPETFDFIIIDECHRSIYNVWRQVLEYFDAFLIGLTATPTNQTIGFFKRNMVQDYSHERAVADGINVGYSVYRIQTKVGSSGSTLEAESGVYIPHRDRRTRSVRYAELDDDLTYTANQLDRDVVAEDQIRLVIRTFKDRLPTEIFPGRETVPKTLVFAKTDSHADDIVRIIREEFAAGNDFCQKITYRTTGKSPEDLLNEFRNSYNPRIVVTVDMIATGTDVRPLECLLFMRNVKSASYFEQMKGRGSRIIAPDDLQRVTPDTKDKTHFVIVDAIGICENDKTHSKPLDRKPSGSLEKVLQLVAEGRVHADLVSTLAARLARLQRQLEAEELSDIAAQADGSSLSDLAGDLLNSIDADVNTRRAKEDLGLAEDEEPNEEQLTKTERENMTEALKPFHNPKLREAILAAKASAEQIIDEITQDVLLRAGYDEQAKEKTKSILEDFRQFLDENKDEIEALQILYGVPQRTGLRYSHLKELAAALERPPLSIKRPEYRLWRAYEAVEPEKVMGAGGNSLVDLVALVRHAIDPDGTLVPVGETVEARFQAWLAEQEAAGLAFTADQRRWLEAIKYHIKSSLVIERADFDYAPFNQMGGLGKVHEVFGDQLVTIIDELNERLAA